MKEIDERTHCYALMPVEFSQHEGNFRQVRQAAQDRNDSRAAGGDNERGLDYVPKGFNRRVPKPTKLQFEQWRHEEPDLLRKLQGGDYGAAALLAERYRWWLQVRVAEVIKKVRGGLRFDDIFDCALIQFCESLNAFRPGSNNGLMAYLIKAIDGAISDAHQKWQSKGFTELDTRLRRFLRDEANRNMPLEQIQKLFPKYTLEEIAQAQEPIVMQTYGEGAVNDGNGHQDDDDHATPSGYALAAASGDPVNALRSSASQGSKRDSLGYRWPREHGKRNLHGYDVVDSGRGGLAYGVYGRCVQPWSYRRKRAYGSLWNDLVERYAAARERALLRWMGRQRYADLLIERERLRIEARKEESQYLYPWVREKKQAEAALTKRRYRTNLADAAVKSKQRVKSKQYARKAA